MNIPILDLRLAPFVECTNCKALTEYGKQKTCWVCSAALVVEENTKLQICLLNTGAKYQPYTPYVKCPNCRRLLRLGIMRCPDCYEELTEEYAFMSGLTEVLKTIACDHAREIGDTTWVVLAVIVSIGLLVINLATGSFLPSFIVPIFAVVPLLLALIWLYRFGRLDLVDDDEEFQAAKQQIKRTFRLWLLILAAQLFVILLVLIPH